ncbi:hypothetical protein ElyMa_002300300 [Elysia marginata]|uniref:Uncharacterized protein n=1 Tax=Elysia marginata TaxID=1093978 RepID=A0AAV4G355_9GAST|nr:hypothetical protein ElyMa_002300300 [Elysia marginata]
MTHLEIQVAAYLGDELIVVGQVRAAVHAAVGAVTLGRKVRLERLHHCARGGEASNGRSRELAARQGAQQPHARAASPPAAFRDRLEHVHHGYTGLGGDGKPSAGSTEQQLMAVRVAVAATSLWFHTRDFVPGT